MTSFFKWAFDHRECRNVKYENSSHAIFALLFGVFGFCSGILLLEKIVLKYFADDYQIQMPQYSPYIAVLLSIYLFFLIGVRYMESGYLVLYQTLWACNLCMILVVYGVYKANKYLIGAAIITISPDQVLWYFDIIGYLILKKFPIGVAKYLIWPQTSKLRISTSFHHLWFIPLCFYLLKNAPPVTYKQFLCAVFIVFILGLIGRSLGPREMIFPNGKIVYMNINLSWQLWKDLPTKIFDRLKVVPFYIALLSLVGLWSASLSIFFFVVKYIQIWFVI